MEESERREKTKLQEEYAKSIGAPCFISISGYCWSCGRDLLEYYSDDALSKSLITGCPYCHRSFCD